MQAQIRTQIRANILASTRTHVHTHTCTHRRMHANTPQMHTHVHMPTTRSTHTAHTHTEHTHHTPTHSTHPYRAHTAHTHTRSTHPHAAHTCARPHLALLQLPSPHYRKKSQAAELRTSGRHPRSRPRPCGDLGPRLPPPSRASRAETTRLAQGSLNPTGAAPGAPSFREAIGGLRVRPGEQHPHFSRSRGERESGPPDSR